MTIVEYLIQQGFSEEESQTLMQESAELVAKIQAAPPYPPVNDLNQFIAMEILSAKGFDKFDVDESEEDEEDFDELDPENEDFSADDLT